MLTKNATITNITLETGNANTVMWIQFECEDRPWPIYLKFQIWFLSEFEKVSFIMNTAKVRHYRDLIGKKVRVIDNEEERNYLIAIGHPSKNRFIDLHGSEFPVSERRIYWRYRHKR